MCYMLSGTDPFAKMSEANIVYMITVKNKRPAIPPHVDNDPQKPVFKNMIQQLWHRDPDRRSDFETIVKQLSAHVVDPKLKRRMSRKFLRTLPPLLTDSRAAPVRPCPIAGAAKGLSCSRRLGEEVCLSGSPA